MQPPNLFTLEQTLLLLEQALESYNDFHALAKLPLANWLAVQETTPADRFPLAVHSPLWSGVRLQLLLDQLMDELGALPGKGKNPSTRSNEKPAVEPPAEIVWNTDLELQRGLVDQRVRWELTEKQIRERLRISRNKYYETWRAARLRMAESLFLREQNLRLRQEALRNLPAATYDRLFGVQADLERLQGWLSDPQGAKILLVTGLGGVGKTSLARELVRQALMNGGYAKLGWQTAAQVRLTMRGIEPIENPALTPDALLSGLADQFGHPEWAPLAQKEKLAHLCEFLQKTQALLVVDNLETIIDLQALFETVQFLSENSPARIVLTGRKKMETLYPFYIHQQQPLGYADARDFVYHLAERAGNSTLAQADEAELNLIYQATGGNPLAIKLVIGLSTRLTLADLLNHLRQGTGVGEQLYTFLYRGSWGLLSKPARQVLSVLAHLSNAGVELDTIAQIGQLSQAIVEQAVLELSQLNLVEISRNAGDQKSALRYSLHALTRQFMESEIGQAW